MKLCRQNQKKHIGITEFLDWADMLQERLHASGILAIVRGISHNKFLLTFQRHQEKEECDRSSLCNFFKTIKEVTHRDLIVPRIAWVWREGLPIIAWNKETWQRIIEDWGYLLNDQSKPLQNAMY